MTNVVDNPHDEIMTDPDTRGWRNSLRRHNALVFYLLTLALTVIVAAAGQRRPFSSQPLLGKSGELGEDGDSGESALLGESGESGLSGDSGLSGYAVVSDSASVGLARRGCVGPVTAVSVVAVCGEATLAAARTARVAFSDSIGCSSSSSGSSRSHTAPSGGMVTEADAL